MKKVLVLVAVLVILGAGTVFGQASDSASLFLSGVVGEFVAISVNPTTAAQNLLLNQATSSPVLVAQVVFSSNTAYEITATSANNFQLNSGGDNHPYTMQFNGSAIANNGDPVASGAFANNVSRDVTVTYGAADTNLPPGTYTDSVTFTIEAQ